MAYAAFTHFNHFLYGTEAKNDAIMWAATIATGSCLEYLCFGMENGTRTHTKYSIIEKIY